MYLQVIDKALEVGADSSQFPQDWIFHYREKKPGNALVDGLSYYKLECCYFDYLSVSLKHYKLHFGWFDVYVNDLDY